MPPELVGIKTAFRRDVWFQIINADKVMSPIRQEPVSISLTSRRRSTQDHFDLH